MSHAHTAHKGNTKALRCKAGTVEFPLLLTIGHAVSTFGAKMLDVVEHPGTRSNMGWTCSGDPLLQDVPPGFGGSAGSGRS